MQQVYSDPNGNADVVKAVIQADGDYPKLHEFAIANGSGIFSIENLSFDAEGNHWLDVRVVDKAGNNSNTQRANINVMAVAQQNNSPKVSSLVMPSSAAPGEDFSIQVAYSDPNGLQDVSELWILMSDDPSRWYNLSNPDKTFTGIMNKSKLQYPSSNMGKQWVKVYVKDKSGNKSNEVTQYINIETTGRASCESVIQSGNNLPNTYTVELGTVSGVFELEYNTKLVKDRISVSYENVLLYDTGCVGTEGSRIEKIRYSGSSTQAIVRVQPNCEGTTNTDWSYTLHCPSN